MQLIKEFINKNIIVFIVAVSVFALGVATGSFYAVNISASEADELKQLLSGYISLEAADKISFKDVLLCECTNHLKFFSVLLLCAMNFRLIVISGLALAIRGYQLGFAVSFVCSSFGKNGIIVTLASAFFSYFVALPLYLMMFVVSANFAKYRKNTINTRDKTKTMELLTIFLIAYGVLFAAACFEGVLLPFFIDFLN